MWVGQSIRRHTHIYIYMQDVLARAAGFYRVCLQQVCSAGASLFDCGSERDSYTEYQAMLLLCPSTGQCRRTARGCVSRQKKTIKTLNSATVMFWARSLFQSSPKLINEPLPVKWINKYQGHLENEPTVEGQTFTLSIFTFRSSRRRPIKQSSDCCGFSDLSCKYCNRSVQNHRPHAGDEHCYCEPFSCKQIAENQNCRSSPAPFRASQF